MKDRKVWVWIAVIIIVVIAAVIAMNQSGRSEAVVEDRAGETGDTEGTLQQ